MTRKPDCIGVFSLFPTTQSGRIGFVSSGYRPQHLIHENYQTSATHEYVGVNRVNPGESASVNVWFITPEVYPGCIWPGRVLVVLEGSRQMGTLEIVEVMNPILRGIPETFQSIWAPPANESKPLS
jgi:elongation factor Tu